VPAADLHVTLHYLGDYETETVAPVLERVEGGAFDLRLRGPGHFALKGRRKILWIGVETNTPLMALHAQVAAALAPLGYEPERRPYRPHVTLARLAPEAPRRLVERFERGIMPGASSVFECGRFALYQGRPTEGTRYTELRSYALAASAGNDGR
jgi:2'-5' RNA ligase